MSALTRPPLGENSKRALRVLYRRLRVAGQEGRAAVMRSQLIEHAWFDCAEPDQERAA
jgi:hypothetical protein